MHFPARKLRILAERRRNVRILKNCAGIPLFLQHVPETNRPDWQSGHFMSPD